MVDINRFLGGENLTVNGYGTGTLDGNGQAWYDLVKGVSNYPNRPMGLTIWNAKDSLFEGLSFVQSQMWTMTIMHSQNVTMQDIYVNSTSNDGYPARNTDGVDTLYSDGITMRRWEIVNGDDSISLKANSTNILVEDSIFHSGLGFALGSIGQYPGAYEIIENVFVRNITCIGTLYAGYVKTWTGVEVNYPPNGGGGGLGCKCSSHILINTSLNFVADVRNITMTDFVMNGGRGEPFSIGQCTTFSGADASCDTSLLKISNVTLSNVSGSVDSDEVAVMQCSADAIGCDDIALVNITVTDTGAASDSTQPDAFEYKCTNVNNPIGFNCTSTTTTT